MFKWPSLYNIWLNYLSKFIERYGVKRIERTRHLFELALDSAPEASKRIFFVMYANYEETHGLINHAIEILDRMVDEVKYEDKMEAYNLYISKVADLLGVTKTRRIFQKAIDTLEDSEIIQMGLRFAQLERRLGEIDRCRAIYTHISQFSEPRSDQHLLWKIWDEFEIQHGNEDTYKEYKRIFRSVEQKFALQPLSIEKLKKEFEDNLAAEKS